MLFTPAYAQAAGASSGPGLLETLLPFVFIFAIMYFLIIRPQQRKAREHQEMLGALRRGDEVLTAGGFLGKVTKVKDDDQEVEVEIADGVKVRVIKSTISAVMSKTEPAAAKK
ncbi:MAG: preprotein translocase subunit YajC [Rhodobacteraceae bacterium]|nr:preprotein translocase subunit YajC [Paracoccaceae bacterium]